MEKKKKRNHEPISLKTKITSSPLHKGLTLSLKKEWSSRYKTAPRTAFSQPDANLNPCLLYFSPSKRIQHRNNGTTTSSAPTITPASSLTNNSGILDRCSGLFPSIHSFSSERVTECPLNVTHYPTLFSSKSLMNPQ